MQKGIPMAMTLHSTAFENGRPIPEAYSQDGKNLSPPLSWSGAPKEAAEFALIVDDPDAPREEPWVHWLIWKVPGSMDQLPEGVAKGAEPPMPSGARQGTNTSGSAGYDGPAPSKGHGTHHYHFKLYALDAELGLEAGADKAALLEAMEGHVLEEAELVGTYER
jgi:hypothetical protein